MFNIECFVLVILAFFLAGSAVAVVEGIASSLGRLKQERKFWIWKVLVAALSMATYLFLFYLARFFYFYVFIQKNNIAPVDVSAAAYATVSVEFLLRIIAFQRKLLSSITINLFYATCTLASGFMSVLRSLGDALLCLSFDKDEDNDATAGAQQVSSSSSPSSSSSSVAPKDAARGARPRPHTGRACREEDATEAEAEQRNQRRVTRRAQQNQNPNPSLKSKDQDRAAAGNCPGLTRTPACSNSNCADGPANVCRSASGARITVRDAILQWGEEQLLKKYKLLKNQRYITRTWEGVGCLRAEVESGLRRKDEDVKAKAKEEHGEHAARKAREAHEARARKVRAAREAREGHAHAAREARTVRENRDARNARVAHATRAARMAREANAESEARAARAAVREARAARAKAVHAARLAREAREAEEERLKVQAEWWTCEQCIEMLLNQILERSPSHPHYLKPGSSFAEICKSHKQALVRIHPDKHMKTVEDQMWNTELFKVLSGKFATYKEEVEELAEGV